MNLNTRSLPLRPLLGFTAAVLAAHALLLWQPAPGWRFAPVGAGSFITRMLDAPAAAAPTPRMAAPLASAVTAPVKTAPPSMAESSARDASTASTSAPDSAPMAARATTPAPKPATDLMAAAVHLPGSLRLRYKVTAQVRGFPVTGQGELTWRTDGQEYEARLDVSALLMPTRTQRSTGRVGPEGIEPARFSDRTRSEEAAHFDRDKGRIVFSANRPEAVMQPGAQDRLSVLLQLSALLSGDAARYPTGASISLQTASTRDADVWQFMVEGTETLDLPGGRLQTIRLQRSPRFEHDQKVEVWFAPAQEYLPVRLRLTQSDGATVDQEWAGTDRL